MAVLEFFTAAAWAQVIATDFHLPAVRLLDGSHHDLPRLRPRSDHVEALPMPATALLGAATNDNAAVRRHAVYGIGRAQTNVAVAVPRLVAAFWIPPTSCVAPPASEAA